MECKRLTAEGVQREKMPKNKTGNIFLTVFVTWNSLLCLMVQPTGISQLYLIKLNWQVAPCPQQEPHLHHSRLFLPVLSAELLWIIVCVGMQYLLLLPNWDSACAGIIIKFIRRHTGHTAAQSGFYYATKLYKFLGNPTSKLMTQAVAD